MRRRTHQRTSLFTSLLCWLGVAVCLWTSPALANKGICLKTAQHIGKQSKMPAHMLGSIALTESGKWDKRLKTKVAWPWTVTSGGPGEYFPTKAAAIAKVKALKAKGVRNIDVGCMQINLRYHPDAFTSLEQAFDPTANVRYAAKFLTNLRTQWKSWREAVRRYHSSDIRRGYAYEQRVAQNKKELTGNSTFNVAYAKRVKSAALLKKKADIAKRSRLKAKERANAREQASAWRKQKLAEYRARKAARQFPNNDG